MSNVIPIDKAPHLDDDAFCTIQDVEALVQRGQFSAITHPTLQQVRDWMARYAAVIEAAMAEKGVLYTVIRRGNPFPAETTDANIARLEVLCEAANAKGAAAEARAMHEVKDGTGAPTQSEIWLKEYEELLEQIGTDAENLETRPALFSKATSTELRFSSNTEF